MPLENDLLIAWLYGRHMIKFYEFFLGNSVRRYGSTWFRAKNSTQSYASSLSICAGSASSLSATTSVLNTAPSADYTESAQLV